MFYVSCYIFKTYHKWNLKFIVLGKDFFPLLNLLLYHCSVRIANVSEFSIFYSIFIKELSFKLVFSHV